MNVSKRNSLQPPSKFVNAGEDLPVSTGVGQGTNKINMNMVESRGNWFEGHRRNCMASYLGSLTLNARMCPVSYIFVDTRPDES